MRAWLNGDLLADPTQGAVAVTDHGFTVGDGVFEAVKTLAGEPFALTRHLARLERSAAGLGLPAPDLDDVRRGVAAVIDDDPIGRLRITYSAGPHPMGSGRGGGPPTLVVAYSAIAHARRLDVRRHRALDPQRARRHRRPQDHVVRRERHRARPRRRARRHRGGLRQHRRPPVRGHRLQRLLRRRRRAAYAEPRVGLPGRRDPRAGHRVVRRPRGRRARWPTSSPTPARRSSPPRRATSRRSPAGTAATCPTPGPVTKACAETWRAREAETMDP